MKWLILFLWGAAIIYLQWRGQIRLPWQRQILHASSALAPLNAWALLFSKVPSDPTIASSHLPELNRLEDNWETIRDEVLATQAATQQPAQTDRPTPPQDPVSSALIFAGKPCAWALQHCPQTLDLLKQIPALECATLVELPANTHTEPQRAVYAGLLQMQLGLVVPNERDCYTDIDGIRHSCQEGQNLILDPSFVTESRNDSESSSIVLQCEVRRPMTSPWANRINAWIGHQVLLLTGTADNDSQTAPIRAIILARQWLEQRRQTFEASYRETNPTLYKAIKLGLVVLLVLLFLAI